MTVTDPTPRTTSATDPEISTEAPALVPAPRPRSSAPSRWALGVRAFRKDIAAVVSLVFLAVVVLAAICAPLLTPYSPTEGDITMRLEGIGTPGHPLGLDGQGRDLLARLLYGGRWSLAVAVIPVIVAFPVSLTIGLLAGYFRGIAGEVIMRVLDVVFAFPLVLLALAFAAVLGAGLGNVMLAIGVGFVPFMSRVAYTSVVQESSKEYIEAARAAGHSTPSVLFRELLPNVVPELLVYSTTLCGMAIVTASGLSFLGVGVTPPTPDWGIMTSDGSGVLLEGIFHIATIPGLVILLVALAFNLVGDGLRDALDPRKQTA
ncbi:ABC transporter permease [Brevibacterium litoralis]|uniref:ABC transporter permease n=1 Tax=Brevibacterium litoralis TaxID=3138935 RepID=UPI0032ECBCE3